MDVSKAIKQKIVTWKKNLDAIPELAWQETKTSNYIKKQLGKPKEWAQNNALIYSIGKGKEVFFRAELDGLNTPRGIHHVCGHSAHIAALMGAYMYFSVYPIEGFKIYFIFQPAEEGYPSGAQFIETNFPAIKTCKLGIGFHAFPSDVSGKLFNPIFASGDYFEISLNSKSTHIKNKYLTSSHDALKLAAELVLRINNHTEEKSIINVGVLHAGETPNSIAGQSLLRGDIRALSLESRKNAYLFLKRLIEKEQKRTKINISLYYNQGYPLLINDKKLLRKAKAVLPITGDLTSYATEDFSLYSCPTLFLLFGVMNTKDLHEVDFTLTDKEVRMLFTYWLEVGKNLQKLCEK